MISIRPMREGDVRLGLRLKDQAGWNQVERDWHRFLDLGPGGCFVAEWAGRAAGTVTSCRFGDLAWIAMLLVDESFRGRGIGKALLELILSHLEGSGVRTIRLDATDQGRPLYKSLGFRDDYSVLRLHRQSRPSNEPGGACEPIRADNRAAISELDRRAYGVDRGKLIAALLAESRGVGVFSADSARCHGYGLIRPGSGAHGLGPCIIEPGTGFGPEVLAGLINRLEPGTPVLADVPSPNGPAIEWARGRGWSHRRTLWRMSRGGTIKDRVEAIWCSSGPEMG